MARRVSRRGEGRKGYGLTQKRSKGIGTPKPSGGAKRVAHLVSRVPSRGGNGATEVTCPIDGPGDPEFCHGARELPPDTPEFYPDVRKSFPDAPEFCPRAPEPCSSASEICSCAREFCSSASELCPGARKFCLDVPEIHSGQADQDRTGRKSSCRWCCSMFRAEWPAWVLVSTKSRQPQQPQTSSPVIEPTGIFRRPCAGGCGASRRVRERRGPLQGGWTNRSGRRSP